MSHKLLEKYKLLPIQVKASLWFLVCSFLQKGISFITTPIFTRLLTTTEYGQFNVFISWLSIVSIFVTLQLSAGVFTQGLIKYEEDRKQFASSFQGLNLVLVVGWAIVYFLFKDFWNNLFGLNSLQMLIMLIMIWTSSVFSLWAAEQRVNYNYKVLVLLTLIISLAKPIVGILFVTHTQDKVLGRIVGLALVELIGYTGLFFVQLRKGKQFFSAKYWKYALRFNIPLIPHYLSQVILNTSDRIMISNLVGESEAGIYSLAYSISVIMILFNTALMNTISPWIYQKIKYRRVQDIKSIAYITMIVIAGVNLFLIAFAPEAVTMFAPKEYYDAIWVIPPVAMSVFFTYCYDLFAKFEFYFEKSHYITIASIGGAILNIILNFIFIPIFGYYVAGYTTLFCYVIYVIIHYIFMRKVCKENLDGEEVYDIRVLLQITGIFLILGFGIMFTYKWMFIRYLIIGVLLLIVICNKKKFYKEIKKVIAIRKNT